MADSSAPSVIVVVMLVGTSHQLFFGGRFPRAVNSQSARYDTVVNNCSAAVLRLATPNTSAMGSGREGNGVVK